MHASILERFLRYARLNSPSGSEGQQAFARMLVDELQALGLHDAAMDAHGIVMATCPGNLTETEAQGVPVIGLLAHLDTVAAKDDVIEPVVHPDYQGGDVILSESKGFTLRAADNPDLAHFIGDTVVTSDGSTILGADDKAGITAIMVMLEYLGQHPELKHGAIRIAFTVDEENGQGIQHFDVAQFGADLAYALDGIGTGTVETQTFNASTAKFSVRGVNVHPCSAKDRMVNAVGVAAAIVMAFEDEASPATTEGMEGFYWASGISGSTSQASVTVLLRDFELASMAARKARVKEIRDQVAAAYPKAEIELTVTDSYFNPGPKLAEDPRIIAYALEALQRTGLEPVLSAMRGGTDCCHLCERGLLAANIFAGGMNCHSGQEWVTVGAMVKSAMTLVNLVQVWAAGSGA